MGATEMWASLLLSPPAQGICLLRHDLQKTKVCRGRQERLGPRNLKKKLYEISLEECPN